MAHSDMVAALTAAGAVLKASNTTGDGHKLEFYYIAADCRWVPVITKQINGKVQASSQTEIFGDADAGVCIPPL